MKWITHFIFISFLIPVIILTQSCGEKEKATNIIENNDIVLNHTTGIINTERHIFIVLKNDIDSSVIAGLQYKKVLEFTPDVKGKLSVSGKNILEFIPEKLAPNKEYTVTLNVYEIFPEYKGKNNKYKFSFKTMPVTIDVGFDGLHSVGKNEFKLPGTLRINDTVKESAIADVFKIDYNGEGEPELKYQIQKGKIIFDFINIKRGNEESLLTIFWDGRPLGSDVEGNATFYIPAKDRFKVLDYKLVSKSPTKLEIYFSSPLKRNQELEGLIYLDKLKLKPEISINNNIVDMKFNKNITGNYALIVEKGVKDIDNNDLEAKYINTIYIKSPKPEIRFIGDGVITPDNGKVIIPIEAINLRAVDVQVSKIYSNNVLQFLQLNNINSEYIPNEVGEIQFVKKVDLVSQGQKVEMTKWKKYALDLSKYMSVDKGAIYNIKIGFRKIYTDYDCQEDHSDMFASTGLDKEPQKNNSFWKDWISYKGFRWEQRKDPCYPAYYTNDHFVQKNIMSTNLGLQVKTSKSGLLHIFANNFLTAKPIQGVDVKVFTYQKQLLGQKRTNKNGLATFDFKDKKPYFVMATNDADFAYLPISGSTLLDVSDFEVSGTNKNPDIDGYIYGERGVWRPGDSIFISFILSKGTTELPDDHPVEFELKDPFGKSYMKRTTTHHVGPIYKFVAKTKSSDRTGNWMAIVTVGNNKFYKKLKIETVKPNRLKINVDFDQKKYLGLNSNGKIKVNWLNGLPAGGVRVEINAYLKNKYPKFKKFKDYVFYDKAGYLDDSEIPVFDDLMNEDGESHIKINLDKDVHYPGMLIAKFNVKAFEKSGDFSSDYFTKTISPYKEYIGIKFPKGRWGDYQVKRNKDNKVGFVVVDVNGKPVANRKINVGLYNAKWRWWWDDSARDIANYITDMSVDRFLNLDLITDENGLATTNVKISDWGNYLLRVCDNVSGHCSSIMFYSGYYGGGEDSNDFASKLKFQLDKKEYTVGDKAKLQVPAGKNSMVLIAIEKNGIIEETTWQTSTSDVFEYDLDIDKEMFPNAYVHVTVLKKAVGSQNDLPVRRYGIVPLKVIDADRKLIPEVVVPDEIKPESEYQITVKEKNKKAMAYTIAIVDEGLLDLTHFKTPSAYDHFFAKRASGVYSYDYYNYVQQSKKIFFDRIISIGGDDEVAPAEKANKANRFVPVVTYIGPFYLEKGKKNIHTLKMQNYSGAVRVMVVAASDNSYGNYEKSVKVKNDLMILPTVPRVLSPGETFELPITVFATSDKIHKVNSMLKNNDLFEVIGVKNTQLIFEKPGEKLTYFKLKVKDKIGIGKLDIAVNSGKFKAKKHLEIQIDNPNPVVKKANLLIVDKGEKKELNIEKIGMDGTNYASVEVSLMPELKIEDRLWYLLHYPYGCIEQTTSSAFPLVRLSSLLEMPPERLAKINSIVNATIKRLMRFRLNNGGFSYWPGRTNVSDWGTLYATHFLMEAQNSGYDVYGLLDDALKYLKSSSSSNINYEDSYLVTDRAYMLMLLAKSGNPNRASMNYLRNNVKMTTVARWYLALAYTYTGDIKIAKELYNSAPNEVEDYVDVYYNYGSQLRDYSVKLMLLDRLGLRKESALLAKDIIEKFNDGRYNTQAIAYTLIALNKHLSNSANEINMSFGTVDKIESIKIKKPVYTFNIDKNNISKKFVVENKSQKSPLYVNIISYGQPVQDNSPDENKNLDMYITYVDNSGNKLDITKLKMGQEFKAVLSLHPVNRVKDYRNLAVSQIFPSGWEILNWRMGNNESTSTYYITYQDIRDDRVYSFLNLNYQKALSKIEIPLVATYPGRYYMPVQYAESMYDNSIYSKKSSGWVEVVR